METSVKFVIIMWAMCVMAAASLIFPVLSIFFIPLMIAFLVHLTNK